MEKSSFLYFKYKKKMICNEKFFKIHELKNMNISEYYMRSPSILNLEIREELSSWKAFPMFNGPKFIQFIEMIAMFVVFEPHMSLGHQNTTAAT